MDVSYASNTTLTYNADGTGSVAKPDGLSYPLTWKIIGGRLRYTAHWGFGAKTQLNFTFEMPTSDELVFVDRFGHRDLYARVKKSAT